MREAQSQRMKGIEPKTASEAAPVFVMRYPNYQQFNR